MGPISDSSLRYEKMQNKFGSLPFVNLNLKSILAGARIYIATRPQITRRDKREQSASPEAKAEASKDGTTAPNREDTELEDIRRCAFA